MKPVPCVCCMKLGITKYSVVLILFHMGFKEGSKDEALALENSVEAIELMPQKEAEAEPTANF